MTVTENRVIAVDDVRAAIEALAPVITRRSAEIEAARRLPRDLVDDLIGAGCFRTYVPRSHGGIGATLPQTLDIVERLARADSSVGWTVMIGSTSWCDLAGLPRATFDELVGSDTIAAGAFNPSASVAPDGDGYRVSGRWAFASGCEHATVMFGNGIEGFADGAPQMRMSVFDPGDVVIEDTWDVSGLRGTGSHHFHVEDQLVPADRTFDPMRAEPCIDAPAVRIPPPSMFALAIAAVAIGAARGAVDEIVAIAEGKVLLLSPGTLATNPTFQVDLATADTGLRAARALLAEVADETWSVAVDGEPLTLDLRARIRAAGVWITSQAVTTIDAAHRSGGSSSVYSDSPLQRRLRDIHALTQHFLVRRDTLATSGAILAGQDVEVGLF